MKNRLIALFVTIVFKSMARTFRYHWPQGPHRQRYIFALWHQNIFACLGSKLRSPHISMVSRSKDGDIATAVAQSIGFVIARGSSSRGGGEAMESMIEALNTHPLPAALTVDGPRGPAHECKRGVTTIARAVGIPVIPFICLPEHYWEFRSWDRFRLPKPFSRVVCLYGEEIFVPKETSNDDLAKYQDKITQTLNELETKAQAHFGR